MNRSDRPLWRRLAAWAWDKFRRARAWAWLRLPPGSRFVIGGLAVIAGVIGIVVPGIGPWLIPIGVGIGAADYHWIKGKLKRE